MADPATGRSPTGQYILAAVFAVIGLLAIVFDPFEEGPRSNLPFWLLGGLLVLVGIGLAVTARLRL